MTGVDREDDGSHAGAQEGVCQDQRIKRNLQVRSLIPWLPSGVLSASPFAEACRLPGCVGVHLSLVAFSPPVVPSAVSGLCSSLHPIRNVCESSVLIKTRKTIGVGPSDQFKQVRVGGRHARVRWSRRARCTAAPGLPELATGPEVLPVQAHRMRGAAKAHALELCGWRSVREGCCVQALRVGKKPAQVKRWQTWTAHSESLTQKRTHNVARGCTHRNNKHVHARSHSLTHSLTHAHPPTHPPTHSLTQALCSHARWYTQDSTTRNSHVCPVQLSPFHRSSSSQPSTVCHCAR